MKKTAITLIFCSCIIFGYSQNIVLLDTNKNVISNTVFDIPIESNSSVALEILVKNAGSIADTIKVVRNIYTKDAADQTQFCWGGLCYLAATNISNLSLIIDPGDTVNYVENGFDATFTTGSACVTRLVHYKFYNIHNFSDSTGITLRYLCTTGLDDIANKGGIISNIYPNPAHSFVSVNYDINESDSKYGIIFYDILGKAVKVVDLNEKQGTAKINVTDLNAGIYFYSFLVDGKIISTKKLVISNL